MLFGKKNHSYQLVSPLSGKIEELASIPDEIFSDKIMGDGVALIPSEGDVCSPCNGTVTLVYPTKHCIEIKSEHQIEILIHIGIGSVKLDGSGFECYVEEGKTVKRGERIARFDLKQFDEYEINPVTAIVLPKLPRNVRIKKKRTGNIIKGEKLILLSVMEETVIM